MTTKLTLIAYRIAAAALPFLLLVGCSHESTPAINIVNTSTMAEELGLAMVEESLEAVGAPKDLLQDYTLEMLGEDERACGGWACNDAMSKTIMVVFREGFGEAELAHSVCHEIAHIYSGRADHNSPMFEKCAAVTTAFGG